MESCHFESQSAPLLTAQSPLPSPHFEKSGYAPASIEFHIIGATLVPQALWLYNILCGGTPLIQLSIENTQNLGHAIAILHPMWQYMLKILFTEIP